MVVYICAMNGLSDWLILTLNPISQQPCDIGNDEILSFHRGTNWGVEKLRDLSLVSQLVIGGSGMGSLAV